MTNYQADLSVDIEDKEIIKSRRLSDMPHVVVLTPKVLRRTRIISLVVHITTFISFLLAIGLAFYSRISFIDIGLLLVMFSLTQLSITVGFHRLFAHSSFHTTKPIRAILAILGCMTFQGSVIYWVSNHRRHHAYSDRPNDPHSPHLYGDDFIGRLRGLWHAHIGWVYDPELTHVGRYARDMLKDSLIVKINKYYLVWALLGLIIPGLIGGLLTWSISGFFSGLLWGGLVRIFLCHHFTFSVNSICHVFGSRPFKTRNNSTNVILLGIPTGGESIHNNHHAFPDMAIFGLKWWQPDPGGWLIRFLEMVGLAWDIKMPTPEMIEVKEV